MIFNSDRIVAASDAGHPVIGWNNIVTADSITATTSETGHPATNLASYSTRPVWKGATNSPLSTEYLTVQNAALATVSYLAIAGHNFGSTGASVIVEAAPAMPALDSYTKSYLKFSGVNGSTSIVDSASARAWTARGNAQINSEGALLCDGTGDYVDTNYSTDFTLSSGDFTIEMWVKAANDGVQIAFAGQADAAGGGSSNTAWYFVRQTNNTVRFVACVGAGAQTPVTSTTTLLVTGGWMHVAAVKVSSVLKLFINGVQEGGNVAHAATINYSTALLGVGSLGDHVLGPMNGQIDDFRMRVGYAAYSATFTPPERTAAWLPVMEDRYTMTFLQFNGPDGGTAIADSAISRTWTVSGNAHISDGALLCDGTGDYIRTAASPDFNLEAKDFTIDMWLKTAIDGTNLIFAGQSDAAGGASTNSAWYMALLGSSANLLQFVLVTGTTITNLYSTIPVTVAGGWTHIAVVRTGNTLRWFVNGVADTSTSFTTTVNRSNAYLGVGCGGDIVSIPWNGRIDDFRMHVGTAQWTSSFTPPERSTPIDDDREMIFRFPPAAYESIRLRIVPGSEAPQAGVVYAGELMVLERGVVVTADHTPVQFGVKTRVANGMAENGEFLGRINLGSWSETDVAFTYFTPNWYRANFQPFIEAAGEMPFFFAWAPALHPEDTGYCWLLDDPRAGVNPVVDRVSIKMKLQALA